MLLQVGRQTLAHGMVEDDHEPGARVLFHEVDDLWVETGLNRRVVAELVEAAVEVVQLESLPVA